jgi:hypothetical protein
LAGKVLERTRQLFKPGLSNGPLAGRVGSDDDVEAGANGRVEERRGLLH